MNVKTLEKPIFIVGAGRSGSTIFHEMFCRHPQVAWISKLCDVFPKQPSLNNLLLESLDTPLIGQITQNLITQPRLIKPSEAYHFWEYHCPGFTRPCRELKAEDVTHQKRKSVQKALSNLLTTRRQRLLVKITGWSRMKFLKEIFADAKFIHVVRDGRAVVNSVLEVDWWEGWQGPQHARGGILSSSQLEQWERYNQSFVALAAIEFNILMDAMQTAKSNIEPENFIEIRYEDLCEKPVEIFRQTIDFCELEWLPEFEQTVQRFNLRNTNYKWQEDLTTHQQNILEDILSPYLKFYNYLNSSHQSFLHKLHDREKHEI
jgi:omega-hydroxy-beta-dihydromenaquinone-9 sulfotransferase